MRARYLLTLLILTLLLLVIPHLHPARETYFGMTVQEVAGRPHLLLQEEETFSIYAPIGDTSLQGWKPLFDSRLGAVYGTFEVPKSIEGATPGLGIFFPRRYAILDVEPAGKNNTSALPLGLEWPAETAAELKGNLFCFGVFKELARADDERYDGVLKAARLNDKAWTEIPTAALTEFKFGGDGVPRDKRGGFWLHAVPLNGRLAVIWRSVEPSQTLGAHVEGLRLTGEGDTWITYFDGEKFSPRVAVKNLPAGNGCIWVENGKLNFLVQTRANKLHTGNSSNAGRVEIWSVAEDGTTALQETVASGKSRLGLINFIAAQRFKYAGADHVIRSTWQRFEVLRKDADNAWTPVPNGAAGLPVFALERWLYAALVLCGVIVLFGVGLAFMRRRQAFAVLQKVRADELLAPLSLRASACLLDWAVVLGATWLVARFDSEHFIDILPSPTDLPYTPFMLCSLAYFVFFERFFGATPGKLAMGLCVVTDNAKWPDLRAVLVRNVAGLYERHPLCLLIAAPMLLFSPRRQRIGDLLSRTVVVQRRGLERLWATQAAASKSTQAAEDPLLESNDRKESR